MTKPVWRIAAELRGAEAAAAAASVLDADDAAIALFEIDEAADTWRVDAYSRARRLDVGLEIRLRLAAEAAGGALIAVAEEHVAERDWLAETRRAFPPVRIGRFLVHGSHWRPPARTGAVALEIDAASAFGTGEHPSTAGCLLALDLLARRRRFRRPLDIGTGSGILAIAAAKRLRRPVRASDIDPEAVRVARRHIGRNGLAQTVRVECAAGLRGVRRRRHDLIFANILARPIARMARDLSRAILPGGVAVLSGLLRRQEPLVLAPYRGRRFSLVGRVVIGDWSTLILRAGQRAR